MIVNKSMFPLQTGFSAITKMQSSFSKLQMQLASGEKAQTLSEMGKDLPVSLSVRARLSKIDGYSASIEQVNLRLSFYNNALTRMDKMEAEARNSAVQGQYGTNNINMATIPGLSKARLDELVTMLNADVNGRYLYGGNKTDKAPVATTDEILYGVGGRAGYQTVVTERRAADLGQDGLGRVALSSDPLTPGTVTLSEDGAHPFGLKLSTVAQFGSKIAVDQTNLSAAQGSLSFTFQDDPDLPSNGETITLGFTLPDGTETQLTLRAVAEGTGTEGEFVIGADAAETAANFQEALKVKLGRIAEGELVGASTFAASENFFNAAGEPVLRVAGNDPYTATALRVGTATDTIQWYTGDTASVSAANLGRTSVSTSGTGVSLSAQEPYSAKHGFQISNASAVSSALPPTTTLPTVTNNGLLPSSMSVEFQQVPTAGDMVKFTITDPSGKSREISLQAVTGRAGPGQFTIGAGVDDAARIEATVANFEKALTGAMTTAAAEAQGNPRQSVSSAVEENGRVNYGMQANESGYLNMIRSFAAMSVEAYPEAIGATDPNSSDLNPARARFDAMAKRQASMLSEAHNTEMGSIEMITMEIGIAATNVNAAKSRHISYGAQLENLLSDVETVDKETVAMQIMALQTRLQASYQVTSMVSQLSLVNYL